MYYKKINVTNRISIIVRSLSVYDIITISCLLIAIRYDKYGNNLIVAVFSVIALISRMLLGKKIKYTQRNILYTNNINC